MRDDFSSAYVRRQPGRLLHQPSRNFRNFRKRYANQQAPSEGVSAVWAVWAGQNPVRRWPANRLILLHSLSELEVSAVSAVSADESPIAGFSRRADDGGASRVLLAAAFDPNDHSRGAVHGDFAHLPLAIFNSVTGVMGRSKEEGIADQESYH